MKKYGSFSTPISRRALFKYTAGGCFRVERRRPGSTSQGRSPIRLGVLNSFTGGCLRHRGQPQRDEPLFRQPSIGPSRVVKSRSSKEDDQFNPQVGLQKAKKLIKSDKVDLLVDVQASNVALAVLNYMKQQKAFYVVSGAGTDTITWDRYPYLFRTSISAYQLSLPMANYVFRQPGQGDRYYRV